MRGMPALAQPDDDPTAPRSVPGAGARGQAARPVARDAELLTGRNGQRRGKLLARLKTLYDDIYKGFTDQVDRSDDQMDWWDCYNCVLNDNQLYTGNAAIYIPIIHDAVDACVTRFSNQLFPRSNNFVDVVSTDGTEPWGLIAILSHYIQSAKLKNKVAKPLIRNGYVEGQYNLYVDWNEVERQLVSRETQPEGMGPIIGQEGEPDLDTEYRVEDVDEGRPAVKVLHDSDVLVWPANADSVEEALEQGGCVVIVRRWTRAWLSRMIAEGDILEDEGEELLAAMKGGGGAVENVPRDAEKVLREYCGIKQKGSNLVVWEVWHKLDLSDETQDWVDKGGTPRLCRIFLSAGQDGFMALSVKRNPYWNDRCPLLSEPVHKVAGVFKGASLIDPVAPLQYEANDAANEGADAATYAAAPIVLRDPERAGQANLIFNMGAIWDVPPDAVKIAEFPDLTDRALKRIQYCTTAIYQTLSVNPSMMPQQTGMQSRRNQAAVAAEQQVDLLTTAEETSVVEDIFTDLANWFVDLDYQFREKDLTVRQFGAMGRRANMQQVAPLQSRAQYQIRWSGVQQSRNAAAAQQQIAWLNVARGMEQSLRAVGYKLNPVPALELSAQGIFDPRIAPLVILNMREELTVPATEENIMLAEGFSVPVHPLDDDVKHLREHMPAMQQNGDIHGTFRVHIAQHMQQMQTKQQASMQAGAAMAGMPPGSGAQGVPGGAGPGVAGTPQPGAVPAGPRQMKGPPGMIQPEQMPRAGAIQMPRKF